MVGKRNTTGIAGAALAAIGLLALAVPSGSSGAAPIWKPPMPCVAVRAGLPVGAGFCPGSAVASDWKVIVPAFL
jgi:hypothetical protein